MYQLLAPQCRIAMIGNGPLGITVASHLVRDGFPTILRGRQGTVSISDIQVWEGTHRWGPYIPKASGHEIRECRAAFIAVKAYQLEQALLQHLPLLCDVIPIVPIGNGYVAPMIENFAKKYSSFIWRVGLATVASRLDEAGEIHSFNPFGKVVWGPLHEKSPQVECEATLVQRTKGFFQWDADALYLHRKKWLFNTVINTLAGVYRLPRNRDVLALGNELTYLFEESSDLGRALWGSWRERPADLHAEMEAIIKQTGENENSMARDVRLGRRTESEYLAGLADTVTGYPRLRSYHHKLVGAPVPKMC